MENIINLEQLDYRDQLIKQYIDEHVTPPEPESNAGITCELYVYTDKLAEQAKDKHKLYIRCGKGQILDTDTIQFARNKVSNCVFPNPTDPDEKLRKKKKNRGWVIPRKINQVPLTKVYDESLSNSSDKFDYWEVKPLSPEGEVWEWVSLINAFLIWRHNNARWTYEFNDNENFYYPIVTEDDFYRNTYANFLNQWCGLAVVRDGSNITPYMTWSLRGGWWIKAYSNEVKSNLGYGYFNSPFLADGCSIEWFMNTVHEEDGYGTPYDGRQSTFVFVIP